MNRRTVLGLVGPVLLAVATPAFAADVWSDPAPGVRLLSRTTTNPNQRIHAAFTSLCTNGVSVDARSPQATRMSTSAWGSAMGATVAVNGDFYRTDRTLPTVYGDAVGQGIRWPTAQTGLSSEFANEWYYGDYGWIAFGDGWVELNHSGWVKDHAEELGIRLGYLAGKRTTTIPAGTRALVSGFPELVVEGQARSTFPDRGDCSSRHPRTAMGLSADKRTFILVTVDGRTTSAVGMTCAELAKLMHELGAYTAFNLDGGGSTEMYVAGRGTVNRPSDGSPRPVANHWGVFAKGGDSAPRSCFQPGGCFPSALPEAKDARFRDLPDDTAGAALAARAVDDGLISTCQASPPLFCPNCGLSRRDAIALVVRAAGLDTTSTGSTPSFADVSADDPAFAEIEAAAAANIATGCGDGKLCPDDVVTRGEVAALIARARGWTASGTSGLADVPTDHAFRAEIDAVATRCAASGCSEDAFCPDDAMPRLDALRLVGAAFGLDTEGACSDAADPDGDGDGNGDGAGDPGGCSASEGAAAAWGGLVLVCVTAIGGRRRRVTPRD